MPNSIKDLKEVEETSGINRSFEGLPIDPEGPELVLHAEFRRRRYTEPPAIKHCGTRRGRGEGRPMEWAP